jgi:hypothetical protein
MTAVVGSATAYLWMVANDTTATVAASEVVLVGTVTLGAVYADGGVVAATHLVL